MLLYYVHVYYLNQVDEKGIIDVIFHWHDKVFKLECFTD